MAVYTYTLAVNLPRLSDELNTAGVLSTRREYDGTTFLIETAVPKSTVDSVVTAHNPGVLSVVQQELANEKTARSEFLTDVNTAIAAVTNNGWDGLTANQRKLIILGLLKVVRFLARRLAV
jgi:hypothetical protein